MTGCHAPCEVSLYRVLLVLLCLYASSVSSITTKNKSKKSFLGDHYGLGPCYEGKSLIEGLNDSVCVERSCLYSTVSNTPVSLDSLHLTDTIADLIDQTGGVVCQLPSGGQIKQPGLPLVSFIFTLHNNDVYATKAILEVFRTAHEVPSAEFIVVRDGGKDIPMTTKLTVNLGSLFGTDITFINHASAMGYGRSNTDALHRAVGKYAVLVNSDVHVLPGWLSLMMRVMITFRGGVGLVGPMMISSDGRVSEAGGLLFRGGITHNMYRGMFPGELPMYHARIVDYISAACLLFHRQKFLDLGLFDKQFEPAYFEDTDAAATFYESGLVTILQPLAVVVHNEGTTMSPHFKSVYMGLHSQLFSHKHATLLDKYCPIRPYSCEQSLSTWEEHTLQSFIKQPNRILLMGPSSLHIKRDPAAQRRLELMHLLQKEGYSCFMEPSAAATYSKYFMSLLADGIGLFRPGTLRGLVRAVRREAMGQPLHVCPWKAVIFLRTKQEGFNRTISRVRQLCPDVPVIYTTLEDAVDEGELARRNISQVDLCIVSNEAQRKSILLVDPNADVRLIPLLSIPRATTQAMIHRILLDVGVIRDPHQWECPYDTSNLCPSVVKAGQLVLVHSPQPGTIQDLHQHSSDQWVLRETQRLETMYPWLQNRTKNKRHGRPRPLSKPVYPKH